MELIIDIRHLYDRKSAFLPKEVAVVSVAGSFLSHWTVKPVERFSNLPGHVQETNNTLTRFVHGL